MKHIPNLKQLSSTDLALIVALAGAIKANPGDYHQALHRQSMAMLFQKTSTRTRVSFEVAMTELGGHAIYIDWLSSNFMLSGIEHEIQYLSRNVQVIMARLMHNADLEKVIAASQVPVINGCCDRFHPCQALTDVLTMGEHFDGPLATAKLTYLGVQNNVSNSLVLICHALGITLTLATPALENNGENMDADVQKIIADSAIINHCINPQDAVHGADFVYTDTWVDMEYFNNPDYAEQNAATLKKMQSYQLNGELLRGINCKIMHDMPIHDGFEISPEMVSDPRSIIYQQAENRLHAQKGLLLWLLTG